MQQELQNLNSELKEKIRSIPKRDQLLLKIKSKIGKIKVAKSLTDSEVKKLFNNKPLVGVDGSIYTYGANFPYNITFYKALAKSTTQGNLEKNRIFTPLSDSCYTEIEQYAAENKISLEAAHSKLKEETLATLEVEVAIQAIKEFGPRVLLMDGGFLRYGSLAPEKWQELKTLALQNDCIAVGVIEEIGTFEIKKILQDELPLSCKNSYDRELLFGLFSPGEWLQVYENLVLKRGYYTCFGRLALNPQACAWDFFEEHREYAEQIIDYLYTITPRQSRGIPLWIDVVDSDVRLTKNMVELFLTSSLDPELMELLLRPTRDKRDY